MLLFLGMYLLHLLCVQCLWFFVESLPFNRIYLIFLRLYVYIEQTEFGVLWRICNFDGFRVEPPLEMSVECWAVKVLDISTEMSCC